MIVLYKGRRGCGKTLTMVKDGKKLELAGYKVLRNFEASFGEYIENEEILNLNKESELQNVVILIDEIQIFFDSRRSMQKQNLSFSNFVQQIRKRNIIILCTTQYSNTIDLRLRQHLDVIAYPNFIKKYEICEVIYQDVTSMENVLFEDYKPKSVNLVYNARDVFKLYNTGEMIV